MRVAAICMLVSFLASAMDVSEVKPCRRIKLLLNGEVPPEDLHNVKLLIRTQEKYKRKSPLHKGFLKEFAGAMELVEGRPRYLTAEEERRVFEAYHYILYRLQRKLKDSCKSKEIEEDLASLLQIEEFLIAANLGIIGKCTKNLRKRYPRILGEDIFQTAQIPAIDSIRQFDPRRGIRFMSFLSEAVMKTTPSLLDSSSHAERIETTSIFRKNRKDVDEIIPIPDYRTESASHKTEGEESLKVLFALLATLHPIDQKIVRESYLEGKTYEEIGAALPKPVSKQRIKQRIDKAMEQLSKRGARLQPK